MRTVERWWEDFAVGEVRRTTGRTITEATPWWDQYPLFLLEPVLGIAILVVALNLLGDAIRDAFDPKTRR